MTSKPRHDRHWTADEPAPSASDGLLPVIGYCRVSTEEQATSGLGLEAQRYSLLENAKAKGWNIVAILEDAGVSGTVPWSRRPALAAAIQRLEDGEAKALVVPKLDRLSRSMLDFVELAGRAASEGWDLIAIDIAVDTSTPMGRFMLNVLGAFAEFERDMISTRTKSALDARRRMGFKLGRPRVLPDDIRRRIIRERDAGRSYGQIAEDLAADGVPTAQGGAWRSWTVQKLYNAEKAMPR